MSTYVRDQYFGHTQMLGFFFLSTYFNWAPHTYIHLFTVLGHIRDHFNRQHYNIISPRTGTVVVYQHTGLVYKTILHSTYIHYITTITLLPGPIPLHYIAIFPTLSFTVTTIVPNAVMYIV